MNNKTITIGVIVALLIGALLIIGDNSSENLSSSTITDTKNVIETNFSEELVSITLDILSALDNFHFASLDNMIGDADKVSLMTELLNDTKLMQLGINTMTPHINNKNEVIALTAQGMTVGASAIIDANNQLVEDLRTNAIATGSDLLDFEYSMSVFLSSQKEGFKLITISAPQITGLMFEFAVDENPTGPIPYTISKQQRKIITDEIERLFADDIEQDKLNYEITGTYNSMILSVEGIRDNLTADTYEEI